MRSSGLPVPKVYGYSPHSENDAGTPYILMEFIQGTLLCDIWRDLPDEEVISVVRQITQLEARMMALPFPAGGSLYFTRDLEALGLDLGIKLDDERFCVGPDMMRAMWSGRRERLDVNRGPCTSFFPLPIYSGAICSRITDRNSEDALVAPARKELAYLKEFGQPILPFQRTIRFLYDYQKQSPSTHSENLERYLKLTPYLAPKDPSFNRFCLRHPDLQPTNIMVTRSPDSGCQIVGVIDWQFTDILPLFLSAGIHNRIQNYNDPVSNPFMDPSPPQPLNKSAGPVAEHTYRRQLVYYHYIKSTKECNPLHAAALMDTLWSLRVRLFRFASHPWKGETLQPQIALIYPIHNWEEISGGGIPCPISISPEVERATWELEDQVKRMNTGTKIFEAQANIDSDGYVMGDYERSVAILKMFKEYKLAQAKAESDSDVEELILNHWPWGDMDEDVYM